MRFFQRAGLGTCWRARTARGGVLPLVAMALAAMFLLFAAGALADPNEQDMNGVAATDQSADSSDDTLTAPDYAAASPTPMSPTGAAAAGSYTTELWGDEDTASPNGVNVVNSSATGSSAVTGVVVDDSTGQPVSGASVILTRYQYCTNCPPACADPPCPIPTIGRSTLATSDAAGGFGFINMTSVTGLYDLTVNANLHGSYEVDNIPESDDTYYQTTALLDGTDQLYDASQSADQTVAQDAAAATLGSGYVSETRVPPSILVARFPQLSNCAKASSSFTLHRYPWRFYLLHTMVGEIDSRWGPLASRAVGSAIQSYAWYRTIRPSGAGGADIENTRNQQCFKPYLPVPTRFVRAAPDILSNRIAAGSASSAPIKDTQYKAGSSDCGSGGVPADQLSQNGAKYLETNCGYTDWKAIVLHYYGASGATVQLGRVPTIPQTSFDRTTVSTGQLRLNFASKVSNGAGRVSEVAWRYRIGKCTLATLTDCVNHWTRIYNRGYSASLGKVPTTYLFSPSGCAFYRVSGANPVGASSVTLFSSSKICPK